MKLWIKKIKQQRTENLIVKPPPKANDFEGLVDDVEENFDGIIPEDCFHEEYTTETLANILGEQDMVIKLLKKHGKSKYLANRWVKFIHK